MSRRTVLSIIPLLLALNGVTARAADFADPGARVFTLVPEGVTDVAALPDGDVVYALEGAKNLPPRLMRLTVDGGSRELRADGAVLLAAGPDGSILRVRAARPSVIERIDAASGVVLGRARVPGHATVTALAPLDDGTTVVAAGTAGLFAIAADGTVGRIPRFESVFPDRGQIAGLADGRFVYWTYDALMIGDRSGGTRVLARGHFMAPIMPAPGGGILAAYAGQDALQPAAIVHIDSSGVITPVLDPLERPDVALGNGDGLPLDAGALRRMAAGGSAVIAADGSLVYPADGLRALVPPDSPRPRIALTQSAFDSFDSGTIRFITGTAGTITATLLDGTSVVAEGRATMEAPGEGELGLAAPRPGRYRVRLSAATVSGSAATIAVLDTRPILPAEEARSALSDAYVQADGDEGGRLGAKLGRCRRDAPRIVRCVVRAFRYSYALDGPELGRWWDTSAPEALATATLRNDGVRTSEQSLPGRAEDGEVDRCLRVRARRRQHRAIAAQIRTWCSGRIRIAATIWYRKGRAGATVTRTQILRRGRTWHANLPIPRRAAAALRARPRLRGQVVVRTVLPTPFGPIRDGTGIPIILRPA